MTSTRKGHADDLAADLVADLIADMERDEVPSVPVERPRFTLTAAKSVYTISSKIQLSPQNWQRPSFAIAPDGFTTTVGPLHLELFLH